MKLLHILLALTATIFNACASDAPKDIRITIRNEWWLTISPNGTLGISSLIDSNPMSMVSTKPNVANYHEARKQITDGQILGEQKPDEVSIALVDDSSKFVVSDDILYDLLLAAGKANQWLGAGLNGRLLSLLDNKPILRNKEMQNKALQPTR